MNTKRNTGKPKTNAETAVAEVPISIAEILEPITRIGVETELSRYPIHNLSKKGSVNIQITKRRPDGVLDVKWEVSYSDRYGQARQLAYKIDTIVVNRKIDEAGRPLPKSIKIGTLTDLCKALSLDPDGGKNKATVKKGMLQNASAFISAKIKYRTTSGEEKSLEAGFTRYSVVFTGEELPDGSEADAIYIVLNEPYREVLNNAPIRPLNYEYLKSLAPSPQRFYEIISSRIYAALKNGNTLARISYSEFCTYSALTRHADYENFRVQMAKVHRPHLKSGYIARIVYEKNLDQSNGPDWMMCYKPGPRAKAEYCTFSRRSKLAESPEVVIEGKAEVILDEVIFDAEQPVADLLAATPIAEHPLLEELTKRGIGLAKARMILTNLTEGQQVCDQLEWADELLANEPKKFKNPAGFYVYVLTDNVMPAPGFESGRQREAKQNAQARHDEEYCKRQQQQIDYEEYCYYEIERFAKSLPEAELQEIDVRKRHKMAAWIKSFSQMTRENQNSLVWNAVKVEIKPRVPLISFEEFISRLEQGTLLPEVAVIEPGKPVKASKGSPRTATVVKDGQAALWAEAEVFESEEIRRRKALAGLDELDGVELGRRRSAARNYLLTAHPDRLQFHQLLDEGRFDDFTRECEEQLLVDFMKVSASDGRG